MRLVHCRSCGNQFETLTLAYCTPCLDQMTKASDAVRKQTVEPYGWLYPPTDETEVAA